MSEPGDGPAAATLGMRPFERSLPMALMRAREATMRRFRPILKQHGLTEQQWRVLRALTDSDAPRSVGSLAADTALLGPSLSRMLASLAERGLVGRRSNGDDARRTELVITATGRALVAAIAPQSEAQYEQIERALRPGELDALYATLNRIATIDVESSPCLTP